MLSEQMEIPGFERLEGSVRNVQEKREALFEEMRSLQARVLKLELEISLLRIQLEKGERAST